MARDFYAYLQDVLDASQAIEDVMTGISLDQYKAKRQIRSAVEREFMIIGEALKRVRGLDEQLFSSISNARAIVDFRNLLAHEYGAIDDEAVYGLVLSDLVILKAEVTALLLQR